MKDTDGIIATERFIKEIWTKKRLSKMKPEKTKKRKFELDVSTLMEIPIKYCQPLFPETKIKAAQNLMSIF
jgi:hypothetical protein